MSVSEASKKIIHSTAPVLAEHGYAITRTMYKNIFSKYPHVRGIFNQTHQKEFNDKKARQPTALAHSVHQFAEHIYDLDKLAEVIEIVAQKHVSFTITPDLYPVVGEELLGAIKEVLKDAATDEVLKAWGEGYNFLAQVFIDRENQIRKELANEQYGYDSYKPFKVSKLEKEGDKMLSIYLTSKDNHVPVWKPGQYIAVKVPATTEYVQSRNYTLSCAPNSDHYRISINNEGLVSKHLHGKLSVGDEIEVGPVAGECSLPKDTKGDIVLVSRGSGITTSIGLIDYLKEEKYSAGSVFGLCSFYDDSSSCFGKYLEKVSNELENFNFHTDLHSGASDSEYCKELVEMLKQKQPSFTKSKIFITGSESFNKLMTKSLTSHGVEADSINTNFYGPIYP